MTDQAEHALGDADILGIADEGDRFEGGHGVFLACSTQRFTHRKAANLTDSSRT
jgi:hypothetical protein